MHHQELITSLEANLHQLVKHITTAPSSEAMQQLLGGFVEGLDAILYSTIDALERQDPADVDTLVSITSDQGQVMETMRETYLQRESGFTPAEKATILTVTNVFERTVWVTHRLGRLSRSARRSSPAAR